MARLFSPPHRVRRFPGASARLLQRRTLIVEPLEDRCLLSAAPLQPGEIEGPGGPESASLVRMVSLDETFRAGQAGPLGKLDSGLGRLLAEYQAHAALSEASAFKPSSPLLRVSDGYVLIDAVASRDSSALVADLRALGLRGGSTIGRYVSGRLPLDVLDDLAGLDGLQFASPAMAWSNAGLVTSQGDAAMNADDVDGARAQFGVDGSGVTVGVLSDSFDTGSGSYAADIESGDLPAGVTVLADYPGGTDEGRGMMQLIHDVAPGASLAFHTAFNGIADFANGIVELAQAGADIIVDDVIYFEEPMFQDGVVAQAVDTVVNGGAAYFSSAGNAARQSYESPFADSGEDLYIDDGSGPPTLAGRLHDFDPAAGVDYLQSIYAPFLSGFVMVLQWDEPFFSVSGAPGAASDLDIYLANADGTAVYAHSTTRNIGGDPVEILQFTNNVELLGQFNLMITRFAGPELGPGLMKYLWYGSGLLPTTLNEYGTASGTTFGHANAAGAEAVGAAFYGDTPAFGRDTPLLESFSSAGGTPILFNSLGGRLGEPVVRQKPEIVAPDGTNTTFFPPGNDTDGDGYPNFYGTSASAPHAAAVAALMREANPGLTPAAIYTALESTALDMNDRLNPAFPDGVDDDTGHGLVRADLAVGAAGGAPRLKLSITAAAISENGGTTTATVTRRNVSDLGTALVVTLASSDESEAVVPAPVTIPAGRDSSDPFAITAVDDALSDGTQSITITASATDFLPGTDRLDVTDDEPQLISQWASTVVSFSSQWSDPFNPGAWNAIQALGEPDTFTYGDNPTAWAAATEDGNGTEWLLLGYETPVLATGAVVRETLNNGFVKQIDVREAGSVTLRTVWSGSDPSPRGTPVDFQVSWPQTAMFVDAVKVIVNSYNVRQDWEEIDAVQLQGWTAAQRPTVTVTASDASAAEAGTDPGGFTVSRAGSTSGDLTVRYSIAGTAAAGSDYLALAGSVTIADGSESATILVTPFDDALVEGDETVVLTLSPDPAYAVGSPGSATVTVADNDGLPVYSYVDVAGSESNVAGTVSGSYTDTQANDGASESITEVLYQKNRRSHLEHTWTFDVTGGDLGVSFQVLAGHNSAVETFRFEYDPQDGLGWRTLVTLASTAMTSYSATLPVSLTGPLLVRVVDTDQSLNEKTIDTVTIDHMYFLSEGSTPAVSIRATDAAASETAPDLGEFTVSRAGSTSGELTVLYSIGGTATPGSDYVALAGSVTIADGRDSATITVTPVDDRVEDGTESVVLTLLPNDAYRVGASDTASVDIADDDLVLFFGLSETTVYGVVSGDYLATRAADEVSEQLTEQLYAGGKKSRLEHRWTFNLAGETNVEFQLTAQKLTPLDPDDFQFQLSTDGGSIWTDLATVNSLIWSSTTALTLPDSAGTVLVRVIDTDGSLDRTAAQIGVDQMCFRRLPAGGAAAAWDGAERLFFAAFSFDHSEGSGLTASVGARRKGGGWATTVDRLMGTEADLFWLLP